MILIGVLTDFLRSWLRSFRLFYVQQKWRSLNRHNHTVVTNRFSFKDIIVGRHTYGPITVLRWESPGEGLEIGNFCSIAAGVKFILGGGHDLDTLSTYPFTHYFGNREIVATTKGAIKVEDDVWIGTDVTILSGVTIGQGAVIAAGSMITRDVAPYAVMGGNPAKVIRYRFSEEIVEELKKFDFGRIEEKKAAKQLDLLSTTLCTKTRKEISELICKFNQE